MWLKSSLLDTSSAKKVTRRSSESASSKSASSKSRATTILKAMSNSQRLKILSHLIDGEEKSVKELETVTKYRILHVDYNDYIQDLDNKKEDLKFSDLELIFKDLKSLFEKKGFIINWKALEKQSLDETINALTMASPFSLEEKQVLLEAQNLDIRKNKIAEILKTYTHDIYENNTIQ